MDGTNREDQSVLGDQTLTERLREAIEQQPRKMTQQLAREFAVPELEVIRAFPDNRATELAITAWEEIIRRIEALGAVRVLVSNEAATIEVVGQFGGFSTTGEFFNVQSGTLDLHIRWRELASAFAVEKPGHIDGLATYSVQFYNRTGAAAFKVFLNFGELLAPERLRLFCLIRDEFQATREVFMSGNSPAAP
jgi:putative hemin transport protein